MIPNITVKVPNAGSIGFCSANGHTNVKITHNTVLRVVKSVNTTTSHDDQSTATFTIVEGEAAHANENKERGNLAIKEIEPAPRAAPILPLTMMIDETGLLTVKVMDVQMRAAIPTTLQSGTNLSDEEIGVMRSMNRAAEKRIRKRDVWKRRLIQYFNVLRRATLTDAKQRIEFHTIKHGLHLWISEHRMEENADSSINRFFDVREQVMPFAHSQYQRYLPD
jgi:molecular chaperone DnaK (HSP70)